MEPRFIAVNYLRTWFTLDVIASIPFDLLAGRAGRRAPATSSTL